MATNPFSFDQQTAPLSKELGVMPQENQKVLLSKGRSKGGWGSGFLINWLFYLGAKLVY